MRDRFPWSSKPTSGSDLRSPQRLGMVRWRRWMLLRCGGLVLADGAALALAWKVAAYLNQLSFLPIPRVLVWWVWLGLPSPFWLFAGVTLGLFAQRGLYGAGYTWKNYLQAARLVSLVYLGSLVLSYFYDPKLDLPRSLFFTAWLASVGLVLLFRLGATLVLLQLEQRQLRVPVFLIAEAAQLRSLARKLERRSRYQVVGASLAVAAHAEATFEAILRAQVQEVLVADLPETALSSTLFWRLRRQGITLRLLPSSREMLHRRGQPEVVAGLPTLRVAAPLLLGSEYGIKRTMDFVGSLLLLVLLAPLLVGVAIALKLTAPGPVLFCQERMGLHGQVFGMWKFRTMVPEATQLQAQLEAQTGSDGGLFKLKRDPRVIPIGHFLRRTSIDELPQLFNVLLGQMSLVGPRPLTLRDVAFLKPWHHVRHQVLPGMTGLWQVSGRSDIDDVDDVVRLDLYYIDNWSLNLDLEILVETARVILFRQGGY